MFNYIHRLFKEPKLKPFVAALLCCCLPIQSVAAEAAALPEVAWTMVPVIRDVKVSPNGKELMILRAVSKEGPYVVEVYPTDKLEAEPIRFGGGKTDILSASWAQDGYLIVSAGKDARLSNRFKRDDRQAIIRSDGKGGWLDIDPDNSVEILAILPDEPNRILILVDNNDNYIPDVVRFNIKTGTKVTVHRGSDKIPGGFRVDFDGEVRLAAAYDLKSNTFRYWARKKGEDEWISIRTVDPENREDFSFSVFGFDRDQPNRLLVGDNQGENIAGVYFLDLDTLQFSERLFAHPDYDVGGAIFSQKKTDRGRLLGFTFTGKYLNRVFTDAPSQALYDGVAASFPGQQIFLDRSEDDSVIVIFTVSPTNPGKYYLLHNKTKLTFLGARMPLLTEDVLAKVKFIRFSARDGRQIRAYVTVPKKGQKPYPTVVMPHGGPWVRDGARVYDEWAQLLAYNGYLVIQPQYRGSTGFGLEHWAAGDGKWGLEMQDDVDDAALFLVDKGLADPKRLAIHGFSYGGYSAFVGSFRKDSPFQCSIAGAGVSDLDSIGAEFSDNQFLRELQKPTIKGLNPVEHTAKVHMPILVMQGDRDEIVHPKHSRWFVDGLKKHRKEHKYIEIEEMRHGTLSMEHKQIYYSNLIDWLENRCFNRKVASH